MYNWNIKNLKLAVFMTYLAKHGAIEGESEIVYDIPSALYPYVLALTQLFFSNYNEVKHILKLA